MVTTLGENTADVPFSLLYLTAQDGKTARLCESSQLAERYECEPRNHRIDWQELSRCRGRSQSRWPETAPFTSPTLGTVSRISQADPWNVPPKEAIVLPLRAASQERASAFLVAGISPCRAFD